MRQDAGTSVKLPVWRAKYSAEGRILWQVEVRYDEDVGKETQVVVGMLHLGHNGVWLVNIEEFKHIKLMIWE